MFRAGGTGGAEVAWTSHKNSGGTKNCWGTQNGGNKALPIILYRKMCHSKAGLEAYSM